MLTQTVFSDFFFFLRTEKRVKLFTEISLDSTGFKMLNREFIFNYLFQICEMQQFDTVISQEIYSQKVSKDVETYKNEVPG